MEQITMDGVSATEELVLLVRLLVATLLAGVIGWERERSGKAAGLRTHMLVGVTSALFGALGLLLMARFAEYGGLRTDPVRIIQSVATGVGFLGAGTIIFASEQGRVRGLTTAASIWAASALGLTAGMGFVVTAAGATAVMLFILRVVSRFDLDR